MSDKFQNLIKYAYQSPFISLIPLKKEVRDRIYQQSLKVWSIIVPVDIEDSKEPSLGFRYSPVLTIFAEEKTLKQLKSLTSQVGLRIHPDIVPCLTNALRAQFLGHLDWSEFQNRVNDLKFKIQTMDIEKIERYLYPILECILWFTGEDEIRLAIDSWNTKKQLHLSFSSNLSLIERIKEFILKLPSDLCLEFLIFLLDFILTYLLLAVSESNVNEVTEEITNIEQVYQDIESSYGCFIGPDFWRSLEASGAYDAVLRVLGIPPDVRLFNQSCVFIYPFPIKQNYQDIIDNDPDLGIDFLWELFSLVLIHEHGHATFRHALMKTGSIQTAKSQPKQESYDRVRRSHPEIEEGLAMEMEYFYALMETDEIKKNKMLELIKDFVNFSPGYDWPYAGKKKLDVLIKNYVVEKVGTSYTEEDFMKLGFKKLYDLIKKWKNNPVSLLKKLD